MKPTPEMIEVAASRMRLLLPHIHEDVILALAEAALTAALSVMFQDQTPTTGRIPVMIDQTLPDNTFEIRGAHGTQRFTLPDPPKETA